jgi:serine protease Do
MNVTLSARSQSAGEPSRATEGLAADPVPGTGSVVIAVPPHSALARAGVRAGDLIVRAGSIAAPTPAQLTTALRDASAAGLLLVVRRDDNRDRVLALPPAKPPQ